MQHKRREFQLHLQGTIPQANQIGLISSLGVQFGVLPINRNKQQGEQIKVVWRRRKDLHL